MGRKIVGRKIVHRTLDKGISYLQDHSHKARKGFFLSRPGSTSRSDFADIVRSVGRHDCPRSPCTRRRGPSPGTAAR